MSTTTFSAFRFDGRQAEAVPVGVRVESNWLVVESLEGTVLERQALDRAIVSEPFDHAPRLIGLDSGATLEVPDGDRGFADVLEGAGVRPSLAVRLQRWWPAVIVAVAALVSLLALAYFKGLPAAARWAAFALPPRFESRMGDQILEVLDKRYFEPSRLDRARRAQIADRFARAAAAIAPTVPYRLEFRATRQPSVNAMALPGGIVVLLDGLVEFAADEEAVLGVLGHEFGHVVHKHVTRNVFQSGGVGVLAGLLWGDFSSAAAGVPIALGTLRYSRQFEREADEFTLAFLRAQNVSTQPLYEFFVRMQAQESRSGIADIPGFLSTHPPTEERLKRLCEGDSH